MHLQFAKNCGLNDSILENAKRLIDIDSISVEEILKNIYVDKIKIEEEKEKILKNSAEIELLKKKLEKNTNDYDKKASEIISNAKEEAKQILLLAKDDANNIIKELENTATLSKANKMRNKLNDKIKENTATPKMDDGNLKPEDIIIGQTVFAIPINQVGTVLSMPNKNGEICLQVGFSKMYFRVNELKNSSENKSFNIPQKNKSTYNSKSSQISTELKVIGYTVEEANLVIDKFLDDAVLAKLTSVRIIHGKGTGVLRAGIHAFLKKHPHVKSYKLASLGQGDMGVTIVELT